MNHLQNPHFTNDLKGGFPCKIHNSKQRQSQNAWTDYDGRPISSYYNTLSLLSGCARCIQGSVGKSPELSRGKLRCRLPAIGLGIFLLSIYIAFSRYGTIRLGKPDEKPLYSNFAWGSMMFTSGLAADILFYSLCEWVLYANDPHLAEMGSIQDWASTYPLFHWGLIPWGFYVVLAAAFGFMLHVRGCHKQKYSEACRPILGKHTDGLAGTLIDLMAVFALLAGTTTTFTLATL